MEREGVVPGEKEGGTKAKGKKRENYGEGERGERGKEIKGNRK